MKLADLLDKLRSGRASAVLAWSGYGAFFVVALVFAVVLTFPTRQLKAFVEAQARKSGVQLHITEMSLRGIGGVTLEGVDVTVPEAPAKKEGGKPRPRLDLHVDVMRLDFAVWRALRKRELDVRFSFEVGDGFVEGGRAELVALADDSGGDDKASDGKGDDGKSARPPRARRGYKIDVEVAAIDRLPLGRLGVAPAMLAFQDKLHGALDGLLTGSLRVHWGGSTEDLDGQLDLTISDAVLRQPSVELPKVGVLELADLRMGTLTAKVAIDKKGEIAVLKGSRGSDKATAIALEGVDMFGRDIEMVVEERSHILIPPGPAGLKLATLQVHFAFALPIADKAGDDKAGDDKAGDDKAGDDKAGDGRQASGGRDGDKASGKAKAGEGTGDDLGRAKWSSIMELAGDKLRPFERNGYIGMTCTGALARPSCSPGLPEVTVGTRRRARSEAEKAKGGEADKPEGGKTDEAKPVDGGAAAEPERAPEPGPTRPGTIEMQPPRVEPNLPRPAPTLNEPTVEQNVAPRFVPERPEPPRPTPEPESEPEPEPEGRGQRGGRDEGAPAQPEPEERGEGAEGDEERRSEGGEGAERGEGEPAPEEGQVE